MCRQTRRISLHEIGASGTSWRNAMHRFMLELRCLCINRAPVTLPFSTAQGRFHRINSHGFYRGICKEGKRSKSSTTCESIVTTHRSASSRKVMRGGLACLSTGLHTGSRGNSRNRFLSCLLAVVGNGKNSVCANSRGLSGSALQSRVSVKDDLRRRGISSDLVTITRGNNYSASYRKQGCAGVTVRFVYNSISDRWCVVHKPPGWCVHPHPTRPSVAEVLQPLLDASVASRSCNLIAGGECKEKCGVLRGSGQRSQGHQPRKDISGRPLLPRGMLREMEIETAAQDELRGLYFPFQLDADAQGLLLVATDAQMNALLCHLLDESFQIRREFRVLCDVSRLLACRDPTTSGDSNRKYLHSYSLTQKTAKTYWSGPGSNDDNTCNSAVATLDREETHNSVCAGGRQHQHNVKKKRKGGYSTLMAVPYFASSTHWGWSPVQRLQLTEADMHTRGHDASGRTVTNRFTRVCAKRKDHREHTPSVPVRKAFWSSVQEEGHRRDSEGSEMMHEIGKEVDISASGRDGVGHDTGEIHEVYNSHMYRSANRVQKRNASGATVTRQYRTSEKHDGFVRIKAKASSVHENTATGKLSDARASAQQATPAGQKAYDTPGTDLLLSGEWIEQPSDEVEWSDFFFPVHKCLQLYDFRRGKLLAAGKLVSSVSQRHASLRSLSARTDPVPPSPSTPSEPLSQLHELTKRGSFSEGIDACEKSDRANENSLSATTTSRPSEGKSEKQLQGLSRRGLLQLLEGSFLTAPLADYFQRNVLGHSTCRWPTPSTHPLYPESFTQRKAARWGQERVSGRKPAASLCTTENRELGHRQDSKGLTSTSFVLMSTHHRRLTHGEVRTLGLYHVSLQGGAQRTHQIRRSRRDSPMVPSDVDRITHACETLSGMGLISICLGAAYGRNSIAHDNQCSYFSSTKDLIFVRATCHRRMITLDVHFSEAGAPLANDTLYNPECNVSLSHRVKIPYAFPWLAGDQSLRKASSFPDATGDIPPPGSLLPDSQSEFELSLHLNPDKEVVKKELYVPEEDNIQTDFAISQSTSNGVKGGGPSPDTVQRSKWRSEKSGASGLSESSAPRRYSSSEKRSKTRNKRSSSLEESCNFEYARDRTAWDNDDLMTAYTISSPETPGETGTEKRTEPVDLASRGASGVVSGVTGGSRTSRCGSDSISEATVTRMGCSAFTPGTSPNGELSTDVAVHGELLYPDGVAVRENILSPALNQRGRLDVAQGMAASSCSEKHASAAGERWMAGEGGSTKRRAEECEIEFSPAESEWRGHHARDGSERACDSLGLQLFRLVMPDPLRLGAATHLVVEIGPPPAWGGIPD